MQAVTYLRQALDVAVDDADRADMLEQAGRAAMRSSRADLAIELPPNAVRLRDAGDDPGAVALAIALLGDAYAAGRRRDEGQQVVEAGVARLGDLGDDPRYVRLLAVSGKVLGLNAEYRLSLERSREALARAERLGLADVAAETLGALGQAALFEGRLWESRAMFRGSMEIAEQLGQSDLVSCDRHDAREHHRHRRPVGGRCRSSARSSRPHGDSAAVRSRSTRSPTSPRTSVAPATGTGRWASSRRSASTSSTTPARSSLEPRG